MRETPERLVRLVRLVRLLWLLALLLAPGPTLAQDRSVLVIIIDDLGNELEAGKLAASLPGKVNLAILPHTPNGPALAELGLAAGKEILLHAPMSNLNAAPLGAGGLTPDMSEAQLRRTLAESLASTPGVRGINNHMGSQLTAQRQPMEWVMKELVGRGLYFVDSRTTKETVAASIAAEYGIPHLSRNVFLDNEQDGTAVHYKFKEAVKLAQEEGLAIAIGHPHRVTLKYLRRQLPRLESQGIRLALVSEVIATQADRQSLAVRRTGAITPPSSP